VTPEAQHPDVTVRPGSPRVNRSYVDRWRLLPLATPAAGEGVQAGDRVAVIAVPSDPVGTAPVQPGAVPVLETRVLAVEGAQGVSAQTPPSEGLQLTAGNAGPQALQLAVTPKQAETLAWYQQHATLTVVGDPWGVAP